MKNTFGTSVTMTVFGESHGEAVGVVLDGVAPGIEVDENYMKACLARRAPSMTTDTARRENDEFRILSGVFSGKTTGTPICIIVPNENIFRAESRRVSWQAERYCKRHSKI